MPRCVPIPPLSHSPLCPRPFRVPSLFGLNILLIWVSLPSLFGLSALLIWSQVRREAAALGLYIRLLADFPRSTVHVTLEWAHPPPATQRGGRGPPAALRAMAHPAALLAVAQAKTQTREPALVQMEAELNAPADPPPALRQHGGSFALSLTVQRAVSLLDVYLETEGQGGGATAIRGTLCSRRVRGRDRRRPFVYDPSSGQFDQSTSVGR